MRKFYALILLFLVGSFAIYGQSPYTTTGAGGNYNSSASWVSGNMPPTTLPSGDIINVVGGATLTINVPVTIDGTLTNNGTINLSNTLDIDGVFNQSGNACTGSAANLAVNGTVNCDGNGVVIAKDYNFSNSSIINFTGITTTSPSFSSGDAFGTITFNCTSLTTDIEIPKMNMVNMNVTNTNSGSVKFLANTSNSTISNDLTISSGGKVIVESGAKLTVNGTLSNSSGVDGLILESSSTASNLHTGSLITNNSVQATVQRYIPANGWHMFGTGVNGATSNDVAGCYLQYYTESSNEWNYVTATNYDLENAKGYAIYSDGSNYTINFTGNLITNSATTNNLSWGGDGNHGWHIISNPFPSAVIWGALYWSLSNVAGTAKVLNGASWVDKANNSIIASQQGMAIQVTSGTNSFTTPPSTFRAHFPIQFYKSNSDQEFVSFRLTDDLNKSNDIQYVRFYEDASLDYDIEYDSRELPTNGEATEIFIIDNDEKFSTIAIQPLSENLIYPVGIKKGIASNISLEVENFSALLGIEIVLEDLVTNEFYNLSQGTIVDFEVNEGEDVHRFNMHLNVSTGIEGQNVGNIVAWYNNDALYVNNTDLEDFDYFIYDLNGRLLQKGKSSYEATQRIDFNGTKGSYLISIVSDNSSFTHKFLK